MSQNSKLHFQEKIPSFIRKTYEILEENRFPDIIDWSKDEKALVIFKPTEFAAQVLPLYFKHNHLTSFVRQLHMYSFHKRRAVGNDHIYYHELFQKNKKYLLKNIRKKKSEQNQDQSPNTSIQAHDNSRRIAGDDSAVLTVENENLKKMHEDALSKISSLEQKIKDLTQQNQSLWTQLSPQNEGISYSNNSGNSFLIAEKNVSQPFLNSYDDVFADLPVFSSFLNCEENFGDCLETASQSYISSQLSPSDNYDSKAYFSGKQSAKMFFEEKIEDKISQSPVKKESKPVEGIKITFGTWSLESNNFRMLPVNKQDSTILCKREYQQMDDQFSRMEQPRKLVHTSQNYF